MSTGMTINQTEPSRPKVLLQVVHIDILHGQIPYRLWCFAMGVPTETWRYFLVSKEKTGNIIWNSNTRLTYVVQDQ